VSPQCSAIETSIRQLIVNGKSKTALDNAKDFHKKQGSAVSEALLVDAYLARIQALSDQNLAVEAAALIALVRERFPSAKARLDVLNATASAHRGDLNELLRPLTDPGLSPERRASIEQVIQNRVTNLAALAACAVLPPEHALRQAAAAIDKAFAAVTSGPVTDEQIALTEVSHRSPLAPWKLLIRAIAFFYRNDDLSCEQCLGAIRSESAPARLVHAMRAMLAPKPATHLNAAEAALVAHTGVGLAELRAALVKLDQAFAHGEEPGRTLQAVRGAVRECRQGAPDLLTRLKQLIGVKAEVAGLDLERTVVALDGAPRRDANFFRDLAQTLEHTGDVEDLVLACERWDYFRDEATRERWFAGDGLEVAALYLHMAGILGRIPPGLLDELRTATGKASDEKYFLNRGKLFERACRIDPHPDSFAKWLESARENSIAEAEGVAHAWIRTLPAAVEPLLFLMEQAEKRNAFPKALGYLDQAERIDGVNPAVRTARLRLLVAGAFLQLQKKKPHLAAQKLAEIGTLPQARQGDRPAVAAVLQFLIRVAAGENPNHSEARLEAERAFGDSVAAAILLTGCAEMAKVAGVRVPFPRDFTAEQRAALPGSMARVIAVVKDIGFSQKFQVFVPYIEETETQLPLVGDSLSVDALRALGEMGINTERLQLAWNATVSGLERRGATEAYFVLLRAKALAQGFGDRRRVLLATAMQLGRTHHDLDVSSQAVEIWRQLYDEDPMPLTADQAREVLRQEIASPWLPSPSSRPGPNYAKLFPDLFDDGLCLCPDCRRRRGEVDDPEDYSDLDPGEMERQFYERAPSEIPPDMLPFLFEATKQSFLEGGSVDEIISRILGGRGGRKKKGRRR
jgi:tetratricopeptide (TPR) repeat protein